MMRFSARGGVEVEAWQMKNVLAGMPEWVRRSTWRDGVSLMLSTFPHCSPEISVGWWLVKGARGWEEGRLLPGEVMLLSPSAFEAWFEPVEETKVKGGEVMSEFKCMKKTTKVTKETKTRPRASRKALRAVRVYLHSISALLGVMWTVADRAWMECVDAQDKINTATTTGGNLRKLMVKLNDLRDEIEKLQERVEVYSEDLRDEMKEARRGENKNE